MASQVEPTTPEVAPPPAPAELVQALAQLVGAQELAIRELTRRLDHAARIAGIRGDRLDAMATRLDQLQAIVEGQDARLGAAAAEAQAGHRRALLALEGIQLARLRLDLMTGVEVAVNFPAGPLDLAGDAGIEPFH